MGRKGKQNGPKELKKIGGGLDDRAGEKGIFENMGGVSIDERSAKLGIVLGEHGE